MCICIYNYRRVYLCIYTYLHTHIHTHTQTHPYTNPWKGFKCSLSDLKGHSLLQNYIQHHYDLPSVISNFATLNAECYENHELINYTVIPNLK